MARGTRVARRLATLGAALLTGSVLAACSSGGSSPAVLLVGTYHGHAGQYSSIQSAVNAAKPGDYILVGPRRLPRDRRRPRDVGHAAQLG